jgi:hypothetical protein
MLFLNTKKGISRFMCTAVSLTHENNHFFARTLDLEYHYNESVILAPRRYPFTFTDGTHTADHPALLGMAYVMDGYPLYYDAMNEHGLCMAGLAFPHFCTYAPHTSAKPKPSLAPFELIPYVLTHSRTAGDARRLLSGSVLTDIPFSDALPNQPMHWMIADSHACAVLETDENGAIRWYDNPLGVMTNSPPFPRQSAGFSRYHHLTPYPGRDAESGHLMRGMGAVGLPVFSGFSAGIGVLWGANGGFLFGFLISALIYTLLEKMHINRLISAFISMLFCYISGSLWFFAVYSESKGTGSLMSAFLVCVVPFIIPDIIKILLALYISKRLKKHI